MTTTYDVLETETGFVHRTGCGEVHELNGVEYVCIGDWTAYTGDGHVHYMRTVEDETRLARQIGHGYASSLT